MFQSGSHPSSDDDKVDAVLILGFAFRIAGQHAAVVFGASLLIQFGVLVVSFLVMNTFGAFGLLLWPLLVYTGGQLTAGLYTRLLVHLRHEATPPTIGALMSETLPFLPALLWLGLLVGLAILVAGIAAALMTAFIGPVALIGAVLLPLYLALRWAVAAPAMLVKHCSATDAMKLSGVLTQRALASVFLFTILAILVLQVPQLMIDRRTMAFENLLIMQAVINTVVAPIGAIGIAELFLRLAGVPGQLGDHADAAPVPSGPFVPGMPTAGQPGPHVPSGPHVPAMPGIRPAATYAAAPQLQPPAPQAYPPAPAIAPQPYLPAPASAPPTHAQPPGHPAVAPPTRARSVAPPGMG